MMSKEPTFNPDLYPTLPTSKATPQEDALAQWFATQHTQSVDNLEQAARQIIALLPHCSPCCWGFSP